MRVRFWGTRGSLPVSITADEIKGKIVEALLAAAGRNLSSRADVEDFVARELPFAISHTYGGNSSCVELDIGTDEHVLCDLGTGARSFGLYVLARKGPRMPCTFHVFMSHLHWDHIMGFPFFPHIYIPGNRVVIYGCHAGMEEAFRRQHAAPCFPVDFSQLSAHIQFVRLEPGRRVRHAGLDITPKLQLHSGDSYGYRFERGGKAVVYSTDSEHKTDDSGATRDVVEFFRNADLVIFDAMYSLADTVSVKEDWGHSSNVVGVELCQLARAKHLCLYHHEPVHNDPKIASVLQETLRLEEITRGDHTLRISSAYDGLEIAL
ncbi:MAG TPA: MBL fold metallo-hydrolase [Burkholderiales bacterium]|jgi:phosphoribosyl 1,2-cyclic phosphodiesterase